VNETKTKAVGDRDPCEDPQQGDVIVLRDARRFRRVVARDGNDIRYKAGAGHGNPANYSEQKKEHVCWISTWQEWCRRHDVIEKWTANGMVSGA